MLPEGFLLQLLNAIKIGFTYIDENETIVYANNQARGLLGLNDRDNPYQKLTLCHPPDLRQAMEDKLEHLKQASDAEWHRTVMRKGRYLENYYSSVFLDGKYKGVVIATKDATLRETLADDLRKSLTEITVLYEAAQMVNSSLNVKQTLENIVNLAQKLVGFDAGGILLMDRTTREVVYDATYNYSPDEVAGLKRCQPFDDMLERLDGQVDTIPMEDHFTCSLLSKIEMAVPMSINSDINGIWFVENHQGETFPPDRKKMLSTLANLTTTAIKNAWLYERTSFAATVDQLTGLFNRQYFDHLLEMEKEKARMVQSPLSLVMIDINRLKYINDTFGHEAGDYILKEAAAVVRKSLRKGELVFRFGGDEIVIILPGSNGRQAGAVVRRIRENLRQWNQNNMDQRLFLHLGIGSACARDAAHLEKLVSKADERMYQDKLAYYRAQGLTRETTGPR